MTDTNRTGSTRSQSFTILDGDTGQEFTAADYDAARALQEADAFADMADLHEAGAYR